MTFVELFFDLVFVFAVTSVTSSLVHRFDLFGIGRNMLLMWLVWWAWTQFTWTLNPANTDHHGVRLITLAATAAAFFMAQSIPGAFSETGLWFASAYVVVRALGLGLQLRMARADENRGTVITWVGGSSFGLAAVIAGGLLETPWREVLWTVAASLDVLSALWAGRGIWKLQAAHFAERHGLIVIIALGESLIVAGIALREVERDIFFALGTLSAVVAVCALWWIYFAVAKEPMEEYLASRATADLAGEARNIYSLGHLPIIVGIIALAVAIEQILAHPADEVKVPTLFALAGGVALYLAGISYGLWRSRATTWGPWLLAILLAVVAASASSALSGLGVLSAMAGFLVVFALTISRRGRLAVSRRGTRVDGRRRG